MSDQRKGGIAWTDETWNPLRGCSKVSAGCASCYAEIMAARFSKPGEPFAGTITDRHWNGTVRLIEEKLTDPLRWKRPRRIFVNSVSDLFHANVPDEWIDRIFAVMALCPQHTFQVLTKRPERMRVWFESIADAGSIQDIREHFAYVARDLPTKPGQFSESQWAWNWPLPNVWLGVSVENQAAADERIPHLLATPAAMRFLSCEPLLGPLDFWNADHDGLRGGMGGIRWVIAGGERGAKARPMHPDWARSLRDQCKAAGVAYMLKQRGEFLTIPEVPATGFRMGIIDAMNCNCMGGGFVRVGKKLAGHLLDGREHMEFPR